MSLGPWQVRRGRGGWGAPGPRPRRAGPAWRARRTASPSSVSLIWL